MKRPDGTNCRKQVKWNKKRAKRLNKIQKREIKEEEKENIILILTNLKDIRFPHPVEFHISCEGGVFYASNKEFNLNVHGLVKEDIEAELNIKIKELIEIFSDPKTKDKYSSSSKEYRENFLKTFQISMEKETRKREAIGNRG